jgi:aspartate/tyrosine/aromatic aminotransferase
MASHRLTRRTFPRLPGIKRRAIGFPEVRGMKLSRKVMKSRALFEDWLLDVWVDIKSRCAWVFVL